MLKARKDLIAGLTFTVFGIAFAVASLNYDLGTAFKMGPGYFPLVLGGILTLLGLGIAAQGVFADEASPIGPIAWRAAILILAAVMFFGFTVRGLGLVPALAVSLILTAFASCRTGIVAAIVMSAGLTIFCILIFIEGLGVPLRLIGPWFHR